MPIEDVLLLSDKRDCDCLAVVLPAVDETDRGEPTVVVFMARVVAVVGAADTDDPIVAVFMACVVAVVGAADTGDSTVVVFIARVVAVVGAADTGDSTVVVFMACVVAVVGAADTGDSTVVVFIARVVAVVGAADTGDSTVVVFMARVVAVVGAADTGDSTVVVFIARVVAAVLVTPWIVELLVAETVLPGVVITLAEVVSLLSIERDDDCLAVVFRVPAVSSALPVVLTAGAVCSADLEDPTPAGITVWVVEAATFWLVVEPAALSGVSETVLVSDKVVSLLSVQRDGGDCLVVSLLSAVRTVCATPAVESSGIGVDISYLVTVPVD